MQLDNKSEIDTTLDNKRLINRAAVEIAVLFEELLERHNIAFTKSALKPTKFEGIEKALANYMPRICDEDRDELIKDITTVLERFRSSDDISDDNAVRIHPGDLLGRTIEFGNHKWIVAHIEGEYAYLMLSEVLNQTVFGTDVKYEDSELLKAVAAFTSSLPADVLDQCQYVTVNGVTAKVFVPSYEQLNHEWNWPKTAAANRICQYGGSNAAWWTSSSSYSKYVWFVGNGGGFISSRPSVSFGFRPAIKAKISDIESPRDPDDWEVVSERLNSLVPEVMLHGILFPCDTSAYFNAMEKVYTVCQKTGAGMVEGYIAIMTCNMDTDLAVKMLTEHPDAFKEKANEVYTAGTN